MKKIMGYFGEIIFFARTKFMLPNWLEMTKFMPLNQVFGTGNLV